MNTPQLGDMVIVGDKRYRIRAIGALTATLGTWTFGRAIVALPWLEPESEVRGFRRAWRSHRCIPTR